MKKTLLNKLAALLMILAGVAMIKLDNDGTVLILMIFFAIPLFFAKENMVG